MKRFALILVSALLALSLVACASANGGEEESSASVSDYMQASHEHKIYSEPDENGNTTLIGTLTFEDGKGDTAIISDYIGTYDLHSIEIPAKVGTKDAERIVIGIGKEAFYYCTSLTAVVIPEGVTYIGDYAFAGCTGLTSVIIPASVETIGKGAFTGCSALTEVLIADGSALTSIGDYAFNDCSALTDIALPEGLVSIGKEAFRDCSALASVNTPSTLKTIGDMAFYNCEGLNAPAALTLTAGIEEIGEYAFAGINKNYISAPEGSYAAQYVANMRDDGEINEESSTVESSEEATEESSEETSEESTEETSEESTEK